MYWQNMEWRLETWALAHFKRLGIDYQSVNMDQMHDDNLTFNENKTRILAQYPEANDLGPRQVNNEAESFQAQQEAYIVQEQEINEELMAKEIDAQAIIDDNFRMVINETPMFSAKWWLVFLLEINALMLIIALGVMFLNLKI